jgi:peroxiredoxin
LAVIVSVLLLIVVLVFFAKRRPADDSFVSELASYIDQQLPQTPLIELRSGEDYSEKVKSEDVLLIFSITGCDACGKEMQLVVENSAELISRMRIYGVMFEDRGIVEQYIQAHNINFPILLDEGGKLRKELRLKYFPTNFKLRDGTIKDAWFGVESNRDGFLKRMNLSQE